MPLTDDQIKQAITQYGPGAQILLAVPDIAGLVGDAIRNQWSPDNLNAKVMATPWYQTHGQALRNLIMTQASDPAEFQRQLNNAMLTVRQVAGQQGRNVDVNGLAYQYLANGWSGTELQTVIGQNGGLATEGGTNALEGQAGQLQAHLQKTVQDYGVPVTDEFVNSWVNRIQASADTVDGFDQLMKARAKAQYPHFAAQIDSGMTVQQIADPYLATMSKTLEVPQTSITLQDPYIQKALSQRDPQTGAVTSQPMWQFEQTIKADPRYDQTDQAKTEAFTTLRQIGKDFGFAA